MLVSWNWLQEYVRPAAEPVAVGERLMKSGLNLESVETLAGATGAGDTVLDLEVTSNRPDCLGHIGVAREIAVLYDCPLTLPTAQPAAGDEVAGVRVDIHEGAACPRYIARVIRGVSVGPSPAWLRTRLEAVGQQSVNNVVDATNYALLETGQPFHAFDLARLSGGQIAVRPARAGETFKALHQKETGEQYTLDPSMLVIADATRPVALAGVMGGLETGVSAGTTDILLETAAFAPLAIRGTARKLSLFSPSQYRFERGVDVAAMDWASRRCAELILQVAGGRLAADSVTAGDLADPPRPAITLRFAQVERLLGIAIPAAEATAILRRLGLEPAAGSDSGSAESAAITLVPPSWRRDLTREVDLIEEVARIYGYDAVPDDVPLPLTLSRKSDLDRVRDRVRRTLVAHGFAEALTLSFSSPEEVELFDPLPQVPGLAVEHSSRRHENRLRKSLLPSLLRCRRENERRGSFDADLFEIAKVYLTAAPGQPEAEVEPLRVGLVCGRPFLEVKGVVESLVAELNQSATLAVQPLELPGFAAGQGAELLINGVPCGWLGRLSREVQQSRLLELRDEVTVVELDFATLQQAARLVATMTPVPVYPGIERDLNFVLAEDVPWADLARVVAQAAGPLLERTAFAGQYRGGQLGADKKSYVARLLFRSPTGTLTGDAVETPVQQVIAACEQQLSATLRA